MILAISPSSIVVRSMPENCLKQVVLARPKGRVGFKRGYGNLDHSQLRQWKTLGGSARILPGPAFQNQHSSGDILSPPDTANDTFRIKLANPLSLSPK